MTKQCLYIIGTDTDVGKTVITAALAHSLTSQNKRVLIIKPIQTGCLRNENNVFIAPDIHVYKDASPAADARVCLMLKNACSPHLAAQLEGISLCANSIAKAIEQEINTSDADTILIEGAGGLLTPLNQTESLADVFSILAQNLCDSITFSVLLVVANKLGAINHALLSCKTISNYGLNLLGFVMTQTHKNTQDETNQDETIQHETTQDNTKNNLLCSIQKDNAHYIAKVANIPCLGHSKYSHLLHHDDFAKRQEGWNCLSNELNNIVKFLDTIQMPPSEIKLEEINENNGNKGNKGNKGSKGNSGKEENNISEENKEKEENNGKKSKIIEYDQKHIWHPYTSVLTPLPVWEAVSTQGTLIRLRDGRELIDGMSSWWCAIHGYNHPTLLKALHAQANRMPHVMFGGLTHKPAVNLAEKLLAVVPQNLKHVFFSDSGSVAVEVAIKMAVQYQQAIGNSKRKRILAFKGAYHGDTLGAMSVCDPKNSMHSLFTGVLPQQLFAPRPDCPFHLAYDPNSIKAFEEILNNESATIAAVIIEPIVQGAGGMYFYHPEYLRAVSLLCKKHNCLLIVDEIATGFGRTGTYFACEHAKIQPDILCLGKGLTGGVLSLAATIASREVAEGICTSHSLTSGVFMHGPTFMGNPLACAVASASLTLLEDNTWKEKVKQIEQYLHIGLAPCQNMPKMPKMTGVARMAGVVEVRVLGAIGVVEMEKPVNVKRLQEFFVNNFQVWIRPFSNLIYVMPPYCIQKEELQKLTTAICSAVEQKIWQ